MYKFASNASKFMDRFLSWTIKAGLILILIAVPLIYSSQLQDSFSLPKRAFFQLAVAAILVLLSFQIIFTPERFRSRGTPLDKLLPAWLAWYLVVSLLSIDRADSLQELLYASCLVAFFFIITRNVDTVRQAWLFIVVMAAMGAVESAYGIAERLGVKLLYESNIMEASPGVSRGSILGTFGNANHLAGYLVLAAPLLLACLNVTTRSRRWFNVALRWLMRALVMACFAAASVCIVLAGARTAWIATFLSLILLVAYWVWSKQYACAILTGVIFAILILAFVGAIIIRTDLYTEMVERLTQVLPGKTHILPATAHNPRLLTWRLVPRMILAHPLFGSGPGSFKILYLPAFAHYLTGRDFLAYWEISEKMNETHNEYLQIAIEMGIPGLALFLWMLFMTIRTGWRRLTVSSGAAGTATAALLAAFMGGLAHAFASIPFHVVPTIVTFWGIMALLCCRGRPEPQTPPRQPAGLARRIITVAGLLLFSLVATVASLSDISFSRHFKSATTLNLFQSYQHALPHFQKALALKPLSGRLKFYYGSTLVQLGRYEEGAAILRESKKNFQDIYIYKNLGVAYEGLGQLEGAVEEYRIWRGMGIASHKANNAIALVRLRQGRLAEAEELFKETLRVRPWDWEAHATLGTIQMETGRLDEAIRTLQPDVFWRIQDAYTLYGIALLKAGRYGEAEKNFIHAISMDPRSVKAHNNLGALYYMTGRLEEAAREWQEVLALDPRNVIAGKNLETVQKNIERENAHHARDAEEKAINKDQ